jgi:hypothetical protein
MMPFVKIRIVGDLLPGTEREYQGPSEREALLTCAQDLVCCDHFATVKEAFESLGVTVLYDVCN